ncbi:MAG: 3-phosphoshikimate 1-carboxyvinyltransferase [Balneolaceae bacterium]|nr:3-phosphoshikimate 1-carboxyvinyltransferase [Balneolaceae bacterium]
MTSTVEPASHLKGTLKLPADKSISHRAAMFAALHEGVSTIRNFSDAADPHSTLACLRQLGVSIQEEGDTIIVDGVGRNGFHTPDQPLDCGNSGTTMRLLSGIVGGAGISCTLTGDDSLSARTMKRIIDPLKEMGIKIEARDNDFAPLHIHRDGPVQALHFPLPIASAQLKSCVLLAGLFGEEETEVIETKISRDHTERLLQLPIEKVRGKKKIRSSKQADIPEQSYTVPGDFSAAAFWLVAGSIHPNSSIQLPSVGMNPTRTGALDILRKMEAQIQVENKRMEGFEPVADLRITSSSLKPVDMTAKIIPNCIDEIPIILVAMLFADGISTVRGAKELRHKETDRLKAMADILRASGADFEEHVDGFTIHGNPDFIPKSAQFKSCHDHRIAMSAAILALKAKEESHIKDADCTAISYPSFWNDLSLLTN